MAHSHRPAGARRWPPNPLTTRWLWSGTAVSVLFLALGGGVTTVVTLWWGGARWPVAVTVLGTTALLAVAAGLTCGSRIVMVVVASLCLITMTLGAVSLSAEALARNAERVESVVSEAHPTRGRAPSSCVLRRPGGSRMIPHRLSPCDGHRPGDRIWVIVDRQGRQAPREGSLRDVDGAVTGRWAVGGVAALLAVLLSVPPVFARATRRSPGAPRRTETN
ncbi:hypothetical protein [Streptomyces sp. DT171]|uniref:hypothetical protein n=1 Tax=Streptomyces sp. DT171 TaxID=3416524 RepID=UPI003CF333A6